MRQLYKPNLDLHIYRARVHDVGKCGDDRLQVRIMPYMADYPDTESANLPKYPCMFKGTIINCYTELAPNPSNKQADWVFVAATEDYTVGYIIGIANQFYACNDTPFIDSYGYKYVQDFISSRGLDTSYVNYDEMVVEKWITTKDGGMVEMYNYKTGEKYLINTSGTCIIMQFDRIYMRVGNPSGTSTTSSSEKFSLMEMTSGEINFKTDLFNVDAKNVVLGHHGLNIVGTSAEKTISVEGVDYVPLPKITV